MKITSKSRTAVMAMVYIARKQISNKDVVSLSEIALKNNLSLSFLEQIFSLLRKKELVSSIRGINGGYTIAKDPNNISVYDIINAIDEVEASTRCNASGCLPDQKKCLTHNLWKALDKNNEVFLSKITLLNVIENNLKLEVSDQ